MGGILFETPGEGVVRLPVIDTAIRRMQTSEVLISDDYYAIAAAARGNAFTVTGDITTSTIERLRDLVYEDLAQGTSREAFMEAVEAAIPGLPISEAHLEQVYRNAVNASFTEGQETILRHPLVEDEFPYRVYAAIRDDRVRDEHRELETLGLDGTAVYHKDDPTWRRFRPPWSWNCRCGWYAITVEQAAALGVREARVWLETGVEPRHEPVMPPNFAPDPRWDRSPFGVLP